MTVTFLSWHRRLEFKSDPREQFSSLCTAHFAPFFASLPTLAELRLIGFSIESIRTPKSKSSTLTPKTNLPTYWPREISLVMNGIIFCVCWTLAISFLQIVLKGCRKETQEDAGEGRVTAKSKPMVNLVPRCSVWTLDVLPSIHLLWAWQLRSIKERWDPLLSHTHQATPNGTLIKTSSSQEWNSDEIDGRWHRDTCLWTTSTRTNLLLITMIWTLTPYAESDVSSLSSSFLHRVNDRVRKTQDLLKTCNKRQRNTFCDLANVHVCNIGSICIHGKELLRQLVFHQKYRRSHNETDVRHIWKVVNRTIRWDLWSETQSTGIILHGKHFWLVAKKSSVSRARRFTYFLILRYALEIRARTHNQIMHGKTGWRVSKVHQNTELWTHLMVSQWNSSGIFPRIHHIEASLQSPRVHVENEHTTRRFHWTNCLHVDVQRHLMGIYRKSARMRIKRSTRFDLCKKICTTKRVTLRTWIRVEVVFFSSW